MSFDKQQNQQTNRQIKLASVLMAYLLLTILTWRLAIFLRQKITRCYYALYIYH